MKTGNPIRKAGIQAHKIGDEWLLYDPDLKKVHILNATAEFVWRLCDGKHDLEALNSRLREEYAVADHQQVAGDLRKILKEFDHISVLQKNKST